MTSEPNKQVTSLSPKVNLHTHTALCKHATGTVSDYAQVAVDSGMTILGMADHCPTPEVTEFSDTRMDISELPLYLAQLDEAAQTFPQLTILRGFELGYFPKYGLDFYRDMKEECRLDYYIGGVHYVFDEEGELLWRRHGEDTRRIVKRYVRQSIELLESGLIDYMTHPDIIGSSIDHWEPEFDAEFRELIQTAIAQDIALEVNAYGVRKGIIDTADGPRWRYPMMKFWELASSYSPRVVIGADAHSPETLNVGWDKCQQLLNYFGLTAENEQLAKAIIARRS
ncbi:MAG: histidinol-phosphatase [Planctomycetia bacterium]|nr:histidinol-phosphatase [Planctomycetia bacterium]